MNPSDENASHVIRLHGPWEGSKFGIRNLEFGIDAPADQKLADVNASKPDRVKVPLKFSDWLEPDFRGTVVLERAFGLPTNLDDQQSVQLVLQTDQLSLGSVSLNGTALPLSATVARSDLSSNSSHPLPYCHEITSLLKARNRLRLTLTVESEPLGGLSYAAIEILER